MDRCPTCNAKFTGKLVCHRCKSDLSLLIDLEKKALHHLRRTKYYLREGNYKEAFKELMISKSILRTEEGEMLESYTLAMMNDFSKAARLLTQKKHLKSITT